MVTIKIETENAAFHNEHAAPDDIRPMIDEVVRILRNLCENLEYSVNYVSPYYAVRKEIPLLDINGNRVGEFIMDPPVKEDSHEKA